MGCYVCTDDDGKHAEVAEPVVGIDLEVDTTCIKEGKGKKKKVIPDEENAKCSEPSMTTTTTTSTTTTTTTTTTTNTTTTTTATTTTTTTTTTTSDETEFCEFCETADSGESESG